MEVARWTAPLDWFTLTPTRCCQVSEAIAQSQF